MYKLLVFLSGVVILGITLANCGGSEAVSSTGKPKGEDGAVATSLRVMSYNIHHANPPSKPDFIDIDAIVKTIRAEDPDLVALQEVDVNTERSGRGNQAELIAEKLGMYAYFGNAQNYGGGQYGNAVLSKFPIKEGVTYNLPVEPGSDVENRVMATTKLKISEGFEIIFASTHLDYKPNSRSRILQMERILEISENEKLPMILAGDFNAVPDSKTIKLLKSEFSLTCESCPPTIPVSEPDRTIDFIAFKHPSNGFKVKSHHVIDETYASDHLPIVAVIELLK